MVVVAVVSCVLRHYGIGDDDGQPEISPSSPPPPPNGPKSIVRAVQTHTHTHTGVDDGRWWVGRIIGGEGENGFRRSAVEYNNNILYKIILQKSKKKTDLVSRPSFCT